MLTFQFPHFRFMFSVIYLGHISVFHGLSASAGRDKGNRRSNINSKHPLITD